MTFHKKPRIWFALLFVIAFALIVSPVFANNYSNFYAYGDAWKATNDTYTLLKFNSTGTHKFLSTGNTSSLTEYICQAGGGAGGGSRGGGGGAGGFLTGINLAVSGFLDIIVGTGGTPVSGDDGNPGTNSSIGSLVQCAGGGGGAVDGGTLNGGSGGGGRGSTSPGTGIPGQGNNGGTAINSGSYPAGGGGGAGSIGTDGTPSQGGPGGHAISTTITGIQEWFAGGGGGSVYTGNGGAGGDDGSGGHVIGGAGANAGAGNGGSGVAGTGSGGGGGSDGVQLGGNGASGVVIIKFQTPISSSITANFTASNTTGIMPLPVLFTDASTTYNAIIDTWNWNFGDIGVGNTSTDQNPAVHTYTASGTYQANLTITNSSYSLVSTKLTNITVHNALPVADFTASNWSGVPILPVQFTDISTGTNISQWNWSFNDGTVSSAQNPPLHYFDNGTYQINLTVTNDGGSSTKLRTVTVTFTPVISSFTVSPNPMLAGQTVIFNDTSTNSPVGWDWNFGDGSSHATTQNTTHVYPNPGSYQVNLTVNDGGYNSSVQTVVVYGIVHTNFTSTVITGIYPMQVQFSDSSTNETNHAWAFGDGNTSTYANPSHQYDVCGYMTVSLNSSNPLSFDVMTKTNYVLNYCNATQPMPTPGPSGGNIYITLVQNVSQIWTNTCRFPIAGNDTALSVSNVFTFNSTNSTVCSDFSLGTGNSTTDIHFYNPDLIELPRHILQDNGTFRQYDVVVPYIPYGSANSTWVDAKWGYNATVPVTTAPTPTPTYQSAPGPVINPSASTIVPNDPWYISWIKTYYAWVTLLIIIIVVWLMARRR